MENDIYNFKPKAFKIPWALCSVPGLFRLPKFISAYRKHHNPNTPYELYYKQDHHSVLFYNTVSLLDINDLHIMQGLFFFEKPFTFAQQTWSVEDHEEVRLEDAAIVFTSKYQKNMEYSMVEDNVVDFFQKINSPLLTFPVAAQIMLFERSLIKLHHQEYNLQVEINNNQKYTETNQVIHGYSLDKDTGNFSTVRGIIPIGKVFNQAKEIIFNEIIAIKSEATRLLHHLLSSKIAPGDKAIVSQATLEEYLYFIPNLPDFDDKKEFIEEALSELMSPAIGWEIIKVPGDDMWSIQR
ncbi:MAG: hypothetical protein LBE38_07190 [Deltaproteobacteria bacterium]|jgi:hypothetical protein|nr:hypothetical protein [Deltaproteobacteria bacterium]